MGLLAALGFKRCVSMQRRHRGHMGYAGICKTEVSQKIEVPLLGSF